ncbi:MAG: hypothetical protein R2804_10485 [Cyclobacteriaceae bacterium]|jgi:hypothetical protein
MKTGIWIDLKKAIFVNLHNDKKEIKTIFSEIEPNERTPGESKDFVRFGNQFSNLEKQKENRLNNQTKEYLNRVTAELSHCDTFVIFGPAGMKTELEKLIRKNKDLSKKLKGVETADSMTENQTAAWVVDYFK